jgi:hypothetical protein
VVNLSWLWLNEAALIVAERLANERPQNSDDAAAGLDTARKELLSWAHRGALEIQGKYWSLPEAAEDSSYLDDKDWISLKSSLWEPERLAHWAQSATAAASFRPEHQNDEGNLRPREVNFELLLSEPPTIQSNPKPYIVVDWDLNSLSFNHADDPYGYCNLRVRALEIDQIIPPPTQDAAGNSDTGKQNRSTSTPPKHPGGAPRKYRDDLLIEIIRIADLDGLPENKSELERQLREWNDQNREDDIPSVSTIYNIVREVYKKLRS